MISAPSSSSSRAAQSEVIATIKMLQQKYLKAKLTDSESKMSPNKQLAILHDKIFPLIWDEISFMTCNWTPKTWARVDSKLRNQFDAITTMEQGIDNLLYLDKLLHKINKQVITPYKLTAASPAASALPSSTPIPIPTAKENLDPDSSDSSVSSCSPQHPAPLNLFYLGRMQPRSHSNFKRAISRPTTALSLNLTEDCPREDACVASSSTEVPSSSSKLIEEVFLATSSPITVSLWSETHDETHDQTHDETHDQTHDETHDQTHDEASKEPDTAPILTGMMPRSERIDFRRI